MENIHNVSDFIIVRATEGNGFISHLKLQKLLYYCQAWHLALFGSRLFSGEFQAWIHGPVNREVYDRFKDTKYMYSALTINDIPNPVEINLSENSINHIKEVLEVFLPFSDSQLESMTHAEKPWIAARSGFSPSQRCTEVISEEIMEHFYKHLSDSI